MKRTTKGLLKCAQVMTKEDALKQGYTLCGFDDTEWQCLMNIADLSDSEITESKIFIADKDSISPKISADSIKEILAENIESDWGNDTGDDTEQVYKTVNSLDFEPTAKIINDALSKIKSYRITKIQLIP